MKVTTTTSPDGRDTYYSSDYDVNYAWSPSESDDTLHNGLWDMPPGGMNIDNGEWVGTPSPADQRTMTYTATDNQNPATATAKYVLTVHEPWDNKRPATPATTPMTQRDYGIEVGVANETSTPMTVPPSAGYAITASVTFGVKFTAGFDVNWAKAFGIELNGAVTAGGTFTITDPGPLLQPGQATFPFVLSTWNRNNYLFDNYMVAGYNGTPTESVDDPSSYLHYLAWTAPLPIGTPPPP